jgi:hypothetical protein
MADDDQSRELDFSRRSMIKKAGVVAGVVWAAPVLTSVPAAAAGTPPPGNTTTTGPTPTTEPPQQCNEETQSGGEGVTDTAHDVGATSGTFWFRYYAFEVCGDRFQIFYEGNQIHDTGFVISGDHYDEVPFNGSSTVITVRVTGGGQGPNPPDPNNPCGTTWDYTVFCANGPDPRTARGFAAQVTHRPERPPGSPDREHADWGDGVARRR